MPYRIEDGEQRWHAVGVVGTVTLLVVVHVHPEQGDEAKIRIIGARKATRHERGRYENDL
ncbi:MAG: BrnT family toxin [Variibacter sp.]|nr:BrnT family toxin [Variibacter sp.]